MDTSTHNVYWMELNRTMNNILARNVVLRSRDDLLKEWSPSFEEPIKYDTGMDYVPVAAPSGAEGLTVLELVK